MSLKISKKVILIFFLLINSISPGRASTFSRVKSKNHSKNHHIIWSKLANFQQLDNSKVKFNSNGEIFKKKLPKKTRTFKEDFYTFISSTTNKDELIIQSELQSEKNNILYAEGNVLVSYKGNYLKADYLTYDKTSKMLYSQGNISLIIGQQIFKISELEYNFKNQKGYLYEVDGLLNIETLIDDIFSKFNNSDVKKIRDFFNINKNKVQSTPNKVINWRFFANKIDIDRDKWKSEKAFFTNDLLELKQFKVVVNSLEVSSSKKELKFKSSLNHLIFDEKISIPFWLGDRTLDKSGGNLKNPWSIGFDKIDKDGLFFGRSFKSFNFWDNFFLDLEPQFLLQRSLTGYSKSFVNPGESVSVPEKVKVDTNFADYFGLKSKIKGKIKNWDLIIDKKLNSFDFDKLSNAIRINANINKDLNFLDSKWNTSFFSIYRDRVWNGSLGEAEIYNGYGSKLEKQNVWEVDGIVKKEILSLGIANIRAEALKNKNLVKSIKGNLFYSLDQKFPINIDQSLDKFIDKSFVYTAEPLEKGLSLNTKLEFLYSQYEGGNNQSMLGFGAGPEVILGNFRKKFLDYTRISLMPFYKINSGESMFKFDQISENFTISIDFDQQLYGSLLLKSNMILNLDTSSQDYGDFINSKVSLNWKKRSYEFGFFYQPHNQTGGISFNLFGFQ